MSLSVKIHRWRLHHVSEPVLVMVLAVVVGLLSGLAAVALKTIVYHSSRIVAQLPAGSSAIFQHSSLIILLLPITGILLTVLFVKHVVRGDIGHGLPSVLLAISRNNSELPAKNMWTSLVASTITVAFGGSVGLEAPIASTGSAIGSNIGRWLRLSPKNVRLLLGCGAAGAIAGIFKAPFAAILFVVEVFLFDLTATTALPLLLSSLTAATVAYFLMGTGVQFSFSVSQPFTLSQLPFYGVLGVFCALVSLYFLRVADGVEGWFAKRKSPWTKLIAGGVALGVMVVIFPPLYGEGYSTLTALLGGDSSVIFSGTPYRMWSDNVWVLLGVLLALIVLKAVATATTIGAGGSAALLVRRWS